MTWHLDDAPVPLNSAGYLVVGDFQYPPNWPAADLQALGLVWVEPEASAPTVEQLCAAVDAERDRRLALDFIYDFGETPALDDAQTQIEAGMRALQMRPEDRSNWQTLQGAALTAVVAGNPTRIMQMRAEDNWNIQTTAVEVLEVLAAMTAHGEAILFAGGAIKSAIRAAADPTAIDIMAGWP